MNEFLAFVKKEFFHILRDKRTILILLGMPVMQIIIFGFAITTEVANVRLAVLNPSDDMLTRQIIERVNANQYFDIKYEANTPEELIHRFKEEQIDLAIVFGNRFSDHLITGDAGLQLIADATDPNMATMRTNYLMGIIAGMQQELLSPDASIPTLEPNIQLLFNPQMRSTYNFVPGVMGLILMLICAMMTSISIVREKEMGTMEVLLVSPIRQIGRASCRERVLRLV